MKITSILLALIALSGTAQPIVLSKEDSTINNSKVLAKSTHAITAAAAHAHAKGENAKDAAIKAAHKIKLAGTKGTSGGNSTAQSKAIIKRAQEEGAKKAMKAIQTK